MIGKQRRRTGNAFNVQQLDKEISNNHRNMIGSTGSQEVDLLKIMLDKSVNKAGHIFIAGSVGLL